MGLERSRATPVVPDWTMVTNVAARKAVEGILAAGHYDSRFAGVDADTASSLPTSCAFMPASVALTTGAGRARTGDLLLAKSTTSLARLFTTAAFRISQWRLLLIR